MNRPRMRKVERGICLSAWLSWYSTWDRPLSARINPPIEYLPKWSMQESYQWRKIIGSSSDSSLNNNPYSRNQIRWYFTYCVWLYSDLRNCVQNIQLINMKQRHSNYVKSCHISIYTIKDISGDMAATVSLMWMHIYTWNFGMCQWWMKITTTAKKAPEEGKIIHESIVL
jgi:hypothetical protein